NRRSASQTGATTATSVQSVSACCTRPCCGSICARPARSSLRTSGSWSSWGSVASWTLPGSGAHDTLIHRVASASSSLRRARNSRLAGRQTLTRPSCCSSHGGFQAASRLEMARVRIARCWGTRRRNIWRQPV
ncbi:unnamed protein product, partial [Polarella glacialis]